MFRDIATFIQRAPSSVLNPLLLTVSIVLATSHNPAIAESVSDRFVCRLGAESRTIELAYLDQLNRLPCEIRETREDATTKTLWRASFDASFCERQLDNHRGRLDSLGWQCETESIPSIINNDGNNNGTSNNSLSSRALKSWEARSRPSVTGTSINTAPGIAPPARKSDTPDRSDESTANPPVADTTKPLQAAAYRPTANISGEVIFYEDSTDPALATSEKPSPPDISKAALNDDDRRQMDDWLIYLSAQSMASIRRIMQDSESFSDYQLAENLDSDNIYSRLQNRIEFLHSLLEKQ